MSKQSEKKRIVIIGAGEVGVTTAIFLDRLIKTSKIHDNLAVTLIEQNNDILDGGTSTAHIFHETGFEYFMPVSQEAGRGCVDGAITKRLIFPVNFYNRTQQSRFFVSERSNDNNDVPLSEYRQYTKSMASYYTAKYNHMKPAERAFARLIAPNSFCRELHKEEYFDMKNVAGGYFSACGIVDMDADRAFKQAFLETAREHETVTVIRNCDITAISAPSDGQRLLKMSNGDDVLADLIVLAAAHNIPSLANLAGGSLFKGTFSLNGMLYLPLPSTSDEEQIRVASAVNFVLQGENGCMYACLTPPSAHKDGLAALYFPSFSGSRFDEVNIAEGVDLKVFREWDKIIRYPHEADRSKRIQGSIAERSKQVLNQVSFFNFKVAEYIKNSGVEATASMQIRPVFNYYSSDSRRRDLHKAFAVTADRRVVAMTSPKWTTCELSSLMLIHNMIETLEIGKQLEIDTQSGLGPLGLDVARISSYLNLDT